MAHGPSKVIMHQDARTACNAHPDVLPGRTTTTAVQKIAHYHDGASVRSLSTVTEYTRKSEQEGVGCKSECQRGDKAARSPYIYSTPILAWGC